MMITVWKPIFYVPHRRELRKDKLQVAPLSP
jgi:hypothetical protein